MEHQDTKLTSMRPRLKELNDNPYLWESVFMRFVSDFSKSGQFLVFVGT